MPDEDVATSAEQEQEQEELDPSDLTEEEQEMAKLKEAIAVEVEEIGTLRKKLTITVPETIVGERRSEQFGEIKRDSVVPGFRKGRAPMRLIEKRFGHDVNEQLSSQLLSSSYLAATEKENLKTIGDPLIWAIDKKADDAAEKLVTVQQAFDLVTLPGAGDFTYSCEVEVRPEFDLPKLEGIEIEQPKIEIGTEQIQAHIDRLRAMRGRYEPVPDDKIQEDDLVVCKLKASLDDKILFEEDNCQLAARPQRVAGILMEELGKVLTGTKVGQAKELDGQIPDDYEDETVRGKTAKVELEVLDIKRMVLPEIDADFLSNLGCESKEKLEGWVKANLESYKSEEVRQSKRDQVYKTLLEKTPMDLPEGMSQQQANRIAARRMLDLARRGAPEAEIAKQADAIRTGAQDDAVNDLRLHFILEKIAEEWEVNVTEDEINGQIAAIAQRQNRRFDRVRDEMIRNKQLSSLSVHVRDEKIVDRIIENATLKEPEAKSTKKKTGTKKKATKKTATKKKGS